MYNTVGRPSSVSPTPTLSKLLANNNRFLGLLVLAAIISYVLINTLFGENDATITNVTETERIHHITTNDNDNPNITRSSISEPKPNDDYSAIIPPPTSTATPSCPDVIRKAVGIYNNITHQEQEGFENVLLLVSANFGYLDFLLNWEYLAKKDKHNLKYGIVAMDIPLYEHLGPDRCILSDKLMTSEDSKFYSKGFADISCNKLAVVMDIMDKCDVDVVFSDVDNIFLEDPFKHDLGRLIKMRTYDYIYLPNYRTSERRSDTCLKDGAPLVGEGNTGFYYLSKKSVVMKETMRNTLQTCAVPTNNKDDQKLFWQELHTSTKKGTQSWYHCSADNGYDTPPKLNDMQTSLGKRNELRTANLCCLDSYYYHIGSEQLQSGEEIPRNKDIITYHGNWAIGKEKKIERMKLVENGWNIDHLESIGIYDAKNNTISTLEKKKRDDYRAPQGWDHIYNKTDGLGNYKTEGEGRYFTLCNKKVLVDKMPSSLGAPLGLPGWKRHPQRALTLHTIPGSGSTWDKIDAFLRAFDVAFDEELSIAIQERQLADMFLGLKPQNNDTDWKLRLEDMFGITVYSEEGSRFSTYIPYNTSQLAEYKSKRLPLEMRKKHQYYVLQYLYQLMAEHMMLHPNSTDTNNMCCNLQKMYGKDGNGVTSGGGLSNKIVTPRYTVLDGQYVVPENELSPDLISSIIDPLGMNASSIVMITDGDNNKQLVETLSSHPVIGSLFQTVPQDSCTVSDGGEENEFSEMMIAILSDVFIGSVGSSFARYVAQVRYVLGIGPSFVGNSSWETFCDEDCLFDYSRSNI